MTDMDSRRELDIRYINRSHWGLDTYVFFKTVSAKTVAANLPDSLQPMTLWGKISSSHFRWYSIGIMSWTRLPRILLASLAAQGFYPISYQKTKHWWTNMTYILDDIKYISITWAVRTWWSLRCVWIWFEVPTKEVFSSAPTLTE